jgi:signal transduction histidine kinase
MRFLEINDGSRSFPFPFRRSLGERMLDLLLDDDATSGTTQLLADFPELTLWCLIQWGGDPHRNSIVKLADALDNVLLDCLQGFDFSMAASTNFPAGWPEFVADSQANFRDRAARFGIDHLLNSQQGLCTLLHNARGYLSQLGISDEGSSLLPAWFCDELDSSESSGEQETGTLPEGVERTGDVQLCDSEFAKRLAQIVSMRHRLAALESDFSETLHREKMNSMKELAYGASHEINNPLANISTRAQTLLRDEEDPERRKKLASINSQAFRAHEMISNMMHFAKPPELQLEKVELTEIVETVVAELQQDAEIQQTELVVNFAASSIQLDADPTHLGKSLKALMVNALEATRRGGTVTITVGKTVDSFGDDQIVISASDTGPGIPAEIRNQIFDPFFSGREAGRGLGFGLSKTWQVVQQHKGKILVQTSDSGTTFELYLPQKQIEAIAETPPEK